MDKPSKEQISNRYWKRMTPNSPIKWVWHAFPGMVKWLSLKAKVARRLPPRESNSARVRFCKFRLRFYALQFGGQGGYGIAYEWLGVSISISKTLGEYPLTTRNEM